MTPRFRGLACLTLAALLPLSSAAGDLTGTWKGKFKCKLQDGESKTKLSSKTIQAPEPGVSTLLISHPEGPGTAPLQMLVDDVLFAGFALPEGGAVKGVGALFDCTDDGNPGDAGELRTFKWKVRSDSSKGKISWRGMFVNDDQEVGLCKGKWKRITRDDPNIGPCR